VVKLVRAKGSSFLWFLFSDAKGQASVGASAKFCRERQEPRTFGAHQLHYPM
jgi:hypothetical protein